MVLIDRIQHARYVYGWRLRHWWLDTASGRQAHVMLAILALLGLVAWTVQFTFSLLMPTPAGAPKQSFIVAIVLIIIALVAAIVAYASMPKPKQPGAQEVDTPTTDDGQTVLRVFGTVWIDDSFLLAWKLVGKDPIKASGGK